ncbi:pyridoxal phosphate-dependent aminotransferase [Legionella fairfieldensis]|uniref:pyridoxal phosphate-dependent aminotransferase n=1 Tax=Legionella fairfieldensis TaxID=45064 RepID=UPI00048F221C|nr:pyridoxal phosphate-dependent aminotransferase [Legionella fairfieldensis]
MLTPEGHSARKIEKVMLLSLWANALKEELEAQSNDKKMILAGLGRPTYPINTHTINAYLSYWRHLEEQTKQWHLYPEMNIANVAVDYGNPRGDKKPRQIMAERMTQWYESEIRPEHILFTVGGIGGLRAIFDTFNTHYEEIPGYRIITPFPHYSVYSNDPLHQLHPIHVMDNPGYKLTAQSLQESIDEAYRLAEIDKGFPKAVLLCNPSNPLGNIIDESELIKIAEVLRQYPEFYLVFDEAYAEMAFQPMPSFLKIAPDLKQRTIILRSATKALSAAGERMAVLLVFDDIIMNELLNKNINYFIHAPRSAQIAYAKTMAQFDANEQKKLATFYKKKVDYVASRLQAIGANMPDPSYHVEATFYVLGDFSDLLGLKLPEEASRVFQKTGFVTTNEELAYYLLFTDFLMIAPLSYFGLPERSGFIRITCSATESELQEMMDRLEQRLILTRREKKEKLISEINTLLPTLKSVDKHTYDIVSQKITSFLGDEFNCFTLKTHIHGLKKIQLLANDFLGIMDS